MTLVHRQHRLLLLASLLFAAMVIPGNAHGQVANLVPSLAVFPTELTNEYASLWVFSDEVSSVAKRRTLINRAAASGIDAIYISVYRGQPNSAGRLMFEDADIVDLIQRARARNIEVWAAYGNVDWHTLGCGANSFPIRRMDEVIAYNQANPEFRFDGVMLDCEPDGAQSTFMPMLLDLYECIFEDLHNEGIKTGAAIRFFWDEFVISPSNFSFKPGYQHLLDLDIEQVVVMGYRDFAGNGNDNGINELDRDEVYYASDIGKARTVIIGLETGNCASGCGPEYVTFFEEGLSQLRRAAQEVANYFQLESGFGGFAIHRYDGAFLSETGAWRSLQLAPIRRR